MSMYNERYDDALSKAPWVSKSAGNGRTYLFKYAPHPERAGYLFVATDLETVYFEALTAPSVPTRLGQVAGRDGDEAAVEAVSQLAPEELQRRTDETLKSLVDIFDARWGSSVVQTEEDDYFDAVFLLQNQSFSWLFNMTELRGRQPLVFMAKHLLAPFAALIAQDRGVDLPRSSSAVNAVGAVVSDSGVARAFRRISGAPPPASSRATPAPRAASRDPTASPTPKGKPAVTPPRTKSPEATPLARPRTPSRASQTLANIPMIPPSSPTPAAKRNKVYDYAAGIFPPSDGPQLEGTSEATSPAPPHRELVPETASAVRPPSSSPPRAPPSATQMDSDAVPSSSAFDAPTSTQDPLMPTQKKKKKKKSKREEEEEEEAEAEKRREAMKKRMAAGRRGGGLGRKRV